MTEFQGLPEPVSFQHLLPLPQLNTPINESRL